MDEDGELSGAFEGLAKAMGSTMERAGSRDKSWEQLVGDSELDDLSKTAVMVGRCMRAPVGPGMTALGFSACR